MSRDLDTQASCICEETNSSGHDRPQNKSRTMQARHISAWLQQLHGICLVETAAVDHVLSTREEHTAVWNTTSAVQHCYPMGGNVLDFPAPRSMADNRTKLLTIWRHDENDEVGLHKWRFAAQCYRSDMFCRIVKIITCVHNRLCNKAID